MTRRAALLVLCAPTIYAAPDILLPRLIYQVRPVYPRLAREARIHGTVRLRAFIDKEGKVESLRLISGHPLLVKDAMDAVRQWRWLPKRYLGVPVSFSTDIEVPFSLSSGDRHD